ncbi:hypothetical protein [Leptospira kirschneri]|uniref:hypothetical protein n=1 Tax=Leptospira kirschneri TaxID=29507 RepID=UPI003563C1E7
MTILDQIENGSFMELVESGEIVSLIIPPYKFRVEEFYSCPVFVSNTVWSELNIIFEKSKSKKSPSLIVYCLMVGSITRVIEKCIKEEEIFLVAFKGMHPQLNRYRAFRKISLSNVLDHEYLLILSINED